MTFEKSNNSKFYFEYHRIGTKAFRDKVRFYEDNQAQVFYLSDEERLEVNLDYAICLFEIGKYHKFLIIVDSLIETVIEDNIFVFNGINIFNDLLFKKAACYYNTGRYIKSEEVLLALVKIDPESELSRSLFKKCKRKQQRKWYDGMKMIAMSLFISAFLISIIELLILESEMDQYVNALRATKISFFLLASVSIVSCELYLNYIIAKEIGLRLDVKEFKKRLGL